uniref:Uncharacterized protein n=1 Tax=Ananas comosus var. bracteatus TaxID=296719 RepID=A0A6V7QLK5_ANACO|nr:unnamed protein product [Ananas comosus var. bracteatus]
MFQLMTRVLRSEGFNLAPKSPNFRFWAALGLDFARQSTGTVLIPYRNWTWYRYGIGLVLVPSAFSRKPEARVCAGCCVVPVLFSAYRYAVQCRVHDHSPQAGTPEIAIATYARPCGIGRRNRMPLPCRERLGIAVRAYGGSGHVPAGFRWVPGVTPKRAAKAEAKAEAARFGFIWRMLTLVRTTPHSSPATPPRPRCDFFFSSPTFLHRLRRRRLSHPLSPFSPFSSPSSFASSAAFDDDASPSTSAPQRSLRRRSLGVGVFSASSPAS